MKKILITGGAGFIGFHLAKRLSSNSDQLIVCIDELNDYYNVKLKIDRLAELGIDKNQINDDNNVVSSDISNLVFVKMDLCDAARLNDLMHTYKFDVIIHLAAQAGVRYSLSHPNKYIDSNIHGFLNLIEGCRKYPVKHFLYASTSSVYGLNTEMPLSEKQPTEHPISLYAATKKANELMAHVYSHLFEIPTTGLRFFTVYGPWGRPDMAIYKFCDCISNNKPIDLYNHGNMFRDFTFVDDIVESIVRLMDKEPIRNTDWDSSTGLTNSSSAPFRIFNIGNSNPQPLKKFVAEIERCMGKSAEINNMPMQAGDVQNTYSDSFDLQRLIGYQPNTSIEKGIEIFCEWYKKYHNK